MMEPGEWPALDAATEKVFDRFRAICAEEMWSPMMLIVVNPRTNEVFYMAPETITPDQLMALIQNVGASLYHTMYHREG